MPGSAHIKAIWLHANHLQRPAGRMARGPGRPGRPSRSPSQQFGFGPLLAHQGYGPYVPAFCPPPPYPGGMDFLRAGDGIPGTSGAASSSSTSAGITLSDGRADATRATSRRRRGHSAPRESSTERRSRRRERNRRSRSPLRKRSRSPKWRNPWRR